MKKRLTTPCLYKIPKGDPVPQTVENLQAIMEKDAVMLENAHKEIERLKSVNAKLYRKLQYCRSRTDSQQEVESE